MGIEHRLNILIDKKKTCRHCYFGVNNCMSSWECRDECLHFLGGMLISFFLLHILTVKSIQQKFTDLELINMNNVKVQSNHTNIPPYFFPSPPL